MATLDPETFGWAIGALVTGMITGGTAVYKWIKQGVQGITSDRPLSNGYLSSFKNELTKFEAKVEDLYLTKLAHLAECKVTKLEGQLALRTTLDAIFKARDSKLDEKFEALSHQVEGNKTAVMEHYGLILTALKELKQKE